MVSVVYKNELHYLSKIEDFRDVMEPSVYEGLVEALDTDFGKETNMIGKYKKLEDDYNELSNDMAEIEDYRDDYERLSAEFDNMSEDYDELQNSYNALRKRLQSLINENERNVMSDKEVVYELEDMLEHF